MNDVEFECKYLDWDCPDWKSGGHVHNWHGYASQPLKDAWGTFTDEQKKIIAYTLNEIASHEHWD